MFLLDTNVVSELRKARTGRANVGVVAWIDSQPLEIVFISVITILEIELGIRRIERRDTAQAAILRRFLEDQVMTGLAGRVLAIDMSVAVRAASLHVPDPAPERNAFIAATALVHDMTVVTRDAKDFQRTGVRLLDPWKI